MEWLSNILTKETMNKGKIIYLFEQPFDERNYERFGIDIMMRRGWEVEVWDITPLTFPSVYSDFISSGKKIFNFGGLVSIKSKSFLENMILYQNGVKYVINESMGSRRSHLILKTFKKMGVKVIDLRLGPLPYNPKRRASLIQSIKKVFMYENMATFLKIYTKKLIQYKLTPDILVLAGDQIPHQGLVKSRSLVINAHSFDFDKFLNYKKSTELVNITEYGIFLDQDICFHPSYRMLGLKPPVTPEKYFPCLNKALNKISDETNCKIIIAKHPKSSELNNKTLLDQNFFAVRESTLELIEGSKFVITHFSTAIQLAVLFNKPIIFLSTDELEKSIWEGWINGMSFALGKTAININRDFSAVNWDKEMLVQEENYSAYIRKYIKSSHCSNKLCWEIVADNLL